MTSLSIQISLKVLYKTYFKQEVVGTIQNITKVHKANIVVPNGITGTRHFLLRGSYSSLQTMSVCILVVIWVMMIVIMATLSVQDKLMSSFN